MEILKKLARSILAVEISELKDEKSKLYKDYCDMIKSKMNQQRMHIKEFDKLKGEMEELAKKNQDLEEQNKIMRKYYELDKEPTDEEKIKIRIDLKIHELEMELLEEQIKRTDEYKLRYLLNSSPNFSMRPPYTYPIPFAYDDV